MSQSGRGVVTGIKWVEVRDAAQLNILPLASHCTTALNNDPSPNMSSARVEKPSPKLMVLRLDPLEVL